MASKEPVSVTWFHVADVRLNLSSGLPQSMDSHREPKKVYSLVAPEPPPTKVLGVTVGLVDGAHWKQQPWIGRAFFSMLSDPPALLLNQLDRSDTGSYVCNVSYNGDNVTDVGMTITEAVVDLFIAVPQQPPVIKDSQGNQLRAIAGPYAEGDTMMLTCAVPAAGHKLTLAWRRNSQPLGSSTATVATPSGGWENHLELGPLFREDLLVNVTCVATSDVTLPAESSVLIDMFLPPAEVSLWSWHHDDVDASGWVMVAPSATGATSSASASTSVLEPKTGSSHLSQGASRPPNADPDSAANFHAPRSFECEATGSRPPANISWFLDGMPLDVRLSHTRTGGNVTASVLLLPARVHAGKLLECRASNDNLGDHRGVLSRYLPLNVSSKPEVSIKLGTGLNASRITEGVDVYMECSVLVTTRITDVKWSRDGQELDADLIEGIVMTSRYLVIRGVTPGHAGSYTCRVTNTHGDTVESTPLLIRVRYPPRCGSEEDSIVRVERDAAVNVTCDVRADPSVGLRYFWLAESAMEATETTLKSRPIRPKQADWPLVTASNRLEIVANASLFNAALACWAENAVGTQRKRCRFKFVYKGGDSPNLTCTVGNYTDSSFSLTCFTPLVDGTTMTTSTRLRQQRRLRVQVLDTRRGNRSERSFWSTDLGPILVNRLRSSTEYLVVVRMPPDASFRTWVRTLGPAQTLISQGDIKSNSHDVRWTLVLSVVVLACSLAVTLMAVIGIYCTHTRRRQRRKRRKPPDKNFKKDTSLNGCEDVDSVHIGDHKAYLATTDSC
ncbi:basement membrane-specific heparan sulfate proteoglycan core protein-like [Dermacentor albipictus]|uniref:basement membrane-specific heparan sulfate proteoglycan core protein-like n=1 Tax=Dermacentor albipictus TaxID=60249 RepID=UPI0038FCFBD8